MKRILVSLCVLAFIIGGASAAFADGIDVKVKGQWDFAFGWATNVGWADSVYHERKGRNDDNFIARHRVRTQINFITSEYLQGVLMFEIGNLDWGRDAGGANSGKTGNGSGGGLDADGVNVETKRAYLDWIIPNTEVSVRMGIQGVKLPSGPMGSPIMDSDVAGIVVSSPINDMFSITGFWIRPFNMHLNDGSGEPRNGGSLDDEMDMFGLVLPIKGDGWAVTPWGAYTMIGTNSGYYEYMYGGKQYNGGSFGGPDGITETANGWWAGLNFELTMFDPFKFTFDAMYGDLHKADLSGINANRAGFDPNKVSRPSEEDRGTRGWFLDATLDYKFDWGTPGIFGWWSSGDSKDSDRTGQMGRMPILSTDTGWQATTFGALGSPNIATEGVVLGSATGTWGVGIQIANMSFIQDLKHTIRVAYYQGTNDSELVQKGRAYYATSGGSDMYLTDKDHVIEVNFDHEYKIYENLTALLELGYIHLSLDDDVWNSTQNARRRWNDGDSGNNAWKAQLQFQYKF